MLINGCSWVKFMPDLIIAGGIFDVVLNKIMVNIKMINKIKNL